jgi:hypothetical protein
MNAVHALFSLAQTVLRGRTESQRFTSSIDGGAIRFFTNLHYDKIFIIVKGKTESARKHSADMKIRIGLQIKIEAAYDLFP